MIFSPIKNVFLFGLLLITISSCKKESIAVDAIDVTSSIAAGTPDVNVNVDVSVVKNDVSNLYKGINITENWEDQSYWNYPTAPATTIKSMGSNIIRAGNDDTFWSEPPYTSPKPHLINYGPNEYLSYQTDIVESDGIHLKSRYLDIDEYVQLCRESNSEPEIIIPYNKIYYKGSAGSNTTAKEDFLRNAESLVNYANKIKGYNIKFWEIGNESWQPSTNVTAENYRDDLIQFSKRMKAVDPSIKIIANGNSANWFKTVLAGAAGSIDFINISYYPTYSYPGYDFYKTNDISYGNDATVMNAIQSLSSTPHNDRSTNAVVSDAVQAIATSANSQKIKLIVTEFNAAGFYGQWQDGNDLGHALVSFQIGADLMSNPSIYFSSFWNLRWYYGYQPNGAHWLPTDTSPKTVFNAADNQGNLNPNGTSLSILYNNAIGAMVDAQSDNQLIRPYACYDRNSGKTNLFLVNKDQSSHYVKVNLKNLSKKSAKDLTAEVWVFTGTGDKDTNPTWKKLSKKVTITDTVATLDLGAESITMVKLK
ncbi:MAG: hypothetical protein ACRYFT_12185 [Janthinobacterium lividum]